ncbi:hypothetical protein [Rhizobium anhuiense]|uniref:hypothetical protein n=1 Tax=Rhizobium anhuiense TaxID=1184720 RepID=UPI001FE1BEAB|nr:hypothetical protein [Rhizobium anhuiense]
MTQPAADKVRFEFVTQCPRDDGCGVFVLQMLTGKPYDQIASMIDWGVQTNHYTTWKELRGVLSALGWRPGGLRKAESWDDVCGVAVVHVKGDHFILYDADNGIFYDPGQPDGPNLHSRLVPMNYLAVQCPWLMEASLDPRLKPEEDGG